MQKGLTGNQLKLIALITMTIDHIGMTLFPQDPLLRIIGRLAYPIYAYMIAEGCRYTRSIGKYLGSLALVAAVCQIVYFLAMESLYQCILVTFSLSVGLIWLVRYAVQTKKPAAFAALGAGLFAAFFLTELLPLLLPGTDYAVDYDFVGVMLPVCVYLVKDKRLRLAAAAICLTLLAYNIGWIQWFGLLALPLLAMYNGQRGKWKMKYFFYIYYPAHLVVIHLISIMLR